MPRGSKPGERRGGRQKGAANKRSRAIADKAAESGLTPLEFMLDVLRAEMPPELKEKIEKESLSVELIQALSIWRNTRFEAAKAAAPYVHPRLQNTTVKVPDGLEIRVIERVIVRE
jgi:hypothetical protein